MRSAQGLRDQTRVTGHGGAGRATFSAPRACPAAAGRGAQVTATARPSSRTRAPAARAQYARPAPHRAMRGHAAGGYGEEGGKCGRRLTHAYIRPSASSTPSPPYRGTCVQQPRHIRAGPAPSAPTPTAASGSRGLPAANASGARARVTWRAGVRQTEARWGSPRARAVTVTVTVTWRPALTELRF